MTPTSFIMFPQSSNFNYIFVNDNNLTAPTTTRGCSYSENSTNFIQARVSGVNGNKLGYLCLNPTKPGIFGCLRFLNICFQSWKWNWGTPSILQSNISWSLYLKNLNPLLVSLTSTISAPFSQVINLERPERIVHMICWILHIGDVHWWYCC